MDSLRLVGCVAAIMLGACSSQLGDSPGQGSGALGGPDAGAATRPDASQNNPPADAAPAPPDATPVSNQPDASVADLCTAKYGDVPGFQLCSTTATNCQFIALNGDISCTQHCSARGGTCVEVVDNKVGSCTDLEPDQTGIDCNTTGKTDLLCRCSVP